LNHCARQSLPVLIRDRSPNRAHLLGVAHPHTYEQCHYKEQAPSRRMPPEATGALREEQIGYRHIHSRQNLRLKRGSRCGSPSSLQVMRKSSQKLKHFKKPPWLRPPTFW
jgi:hypothetical protein